MEILKFSHWDIQYVSRVKCLKTSLPFIAPSGAGKLKPKGQIGLTAYFCAVHELAMIFALSTG